MFFLDKLLVSSSQQQFEFPAHSSPSLPSRGEGLELWGSILAAPKILILLIAIKLLLY